MLREYTINKALRSSSLAPFFGQVAADTIWLIAYLPFLWNNAIHGELTTGTWCSFVCYMVATSYMLSAASGSLLAISTYDIVKSGLHRRPPRLTPKVMIAVWTIAIAAGIGWAAGMQRMGHTGAYRGMFCFIAK